ncbi:hypothetical protein CIL05_06700 [Virgibacillus profundi]|uniref:N-acetylmuramoyl-L-alanine amidase n=1 Tax=Virgibacillus profundi TaxID=2024555 RepID=A0A2A2IG90_9BACI|nr:peptidoglycan-binding protein [Virgibacillus profundi]PAV30150.1 hypothetical protein CIL05_06700 [Virgibacillus profundi]PXY54322.1 hypothetical protein CIT14_06785 [Virgibacillus profundi]
MVKINQMLVSSRRNTYSGTNPCNYIVIHETANASYGANAYVHAKLQRNGFSASWHYTCGSDGVWQSYPDTVQCHHAGDGRGIGNTQSIGIEICVNSDGDFRVAVQNAVELVRHLMDKYDIPATNVIQHNVTSSWGKNCPANLRSGSHGVDWDDFKRMISDPSFKPSETKPSLKPVNKYWLENGDRGSDVVELQNNLITLGYSVGSYGNNGVFGNDTESALRKFQDDYDLQVDGYYGYGSQAAMKKAVADKNKKSKPQKQQSWYLKKGDNNSKVVQLQKDLTRLGYDVGSYGSNGVFGNDTLAALKQFQKDNGLVVDGYYGTKSQSKMKTANSVSKPKANDFNLPNATYWVKSPQFHDSGVLAVQKALSSVYFYPEKGAKNNGCDGYYGNNTADAVRRFQSVHGLKEDGSYGKSTRAKLIVVLNQ